MLCNYWNGAEITSSVATAGTPTKAHAIEYAMVCPACHYRQYPRVQPCVITVITRGEDEILLAKNARNTKSQMYGLMPDLSKLGKRLKKRYVARRWKKSA